MVGTLDNQLTVKYQHLQVILKFSAIPTILPAKQAFEVFVAELTAALIVIKDLRDLSKQAVSPSEVREVDVLLYRTVQATAAYYFPIRDYSIACAYTRDEVLRQPEIVTEGVEGNVAFEECLGPFVRELGDSISCLEGYGGLIQKYTLSEKKRVEILVIFDKAVEYILGMLAIFQRHLNGETDLLEYRWKTNLG